MDYSSKAFHLQEGEYFEYRTQIRQADYVLKEFRLQLKIVADLTEYSLCPYYEEEVYLWAEIGGEKLAIYMGETSFSSFFYSCWDCEEIKESEYLNLPEFIRQSNEMTGWSDFETGPNHIIDISDFLKSLEVVKNSPCGSSNDYEFTRFYYPVLKSFAETVIAEKSTLNILS
ncbi:hypothetical protein [Mucilaginibacter sp. CSA2-8R]|uniref:hypothetical protein n=1 Tax=Mucilaginibacter sp. CSA2-8R TaxID=3141542 RepID=UPI00315CF179